MISNTNSAFLELKERAKAFNSRANSPRASLGRVARIFKNVLARPVVLQCRYGLGFAESF